MAARSLSSARSKSERRAGQAGGAGGRGRRAGQAGGQLEAGGRAGRGRHCQAPDLLKVRGGPRAWAVAYNNKCAARAGGSTHRGAAQYGDRSGKLKLRQWLHRGQKNQRSRASPPQKSHQTRQCRSARARRDFSPSARAPRLWPSGCTGDGCRAHRPSRRFPQSLACQSCLQLRSPMAPQQQPSGLRASASCTTRCLPTSWPSSAGGSQR